MTSDTSSRREWETNYTGTVLPYKSDLHPASVSSQTFTTIFSASSRYISSIMLLASILFAFAGTAVVADCTWPYCYEAGPSYFYACESDADCLSINRTKCWTGLEISTPSETACYPWSGIGEANTTYVTPECIYPYCYNVQGFYTYGCSTNEDCVLVGKTTCTVGDLDAIGFFPGRCNYN